MNKLPTVVIVGRTNVGKSTLFNRLSTDVKSLMLDYEGVTRDFLKDVVCWKDRCFELVDTGGVELRKTDDPIVQKVRQRALSLIDTADYIIFLCDGTVGVLPEDREITKLLRTLDKKVLLAVNKKDVKATQEHLHEFRQLGFQPVIPISAQHGTGIEDLLDELVEYLPIKKEVIQEVGPRYKIVLLGKPNVGKSSLMNLLLKQERALVAPEPGTTREALTEKIAFYKGDIHVTDTPGIRRKGVVREQLEMMMVKTAFRALEEADIVLLLIDITQEKLSDQEVKLAFYAFQEKYKALVMLFNKYDLIDDYIREQMEMSLDQYKHIIKKIDRLNISCKTGKNIGKVLPLVQKVWDKYSQEFSDDEITKLFKEALIKKPLFHKTMPLKVFYARQLSTAPITILLIVNTPTWFGPSQLAFLENILRSNFDLQSVPIKFVVRKKR